MDTSNIKGISLSLFAGGIASVIMSMLMAKSMDMLFALGLGLGLTSLVCYVLVILYEDFMYHTERRDYRDQRWHDQEQAEKAKANCNE
jgi:fucose permease